MSDEAAQNLRENQQQMDMEGIMVGVSRQALDEVLADRDRYKADSERARQLLLDVRDGPQRYKWYDDLRLWLAQTDSRDKPAGAGMSDGKASDIDCPVYEGEVRCGMYCQGGSFEMVTLEYPQYSDPDAVWVRGDDVLAIQRVRDSYKADSERLRANALMALRNVRGHMAVNGRTGALVQAAGLLESSSAETDSERTHAPDDRIHAAKALNTDSRDRPAPTTETKENGNG